MILKTQDQRGHLGAEAEGCQDPSQDDQTEPTRAPQNPFRNPSNRSGFRTPRRTFIVKTQWFWPAGRLGGPAGGWSIEKVPHARAESPVLILKAAALDAAARANAEAC